MKLTKLMSILLVGLFCNNANAECYARTAIKITRNTKIGAPVDVQKLVTPDARGKQCVVHYRVQVDNEWETIEGVGVGKNEKTACNQAMQLSRGKLLQEYQPDSVGSDTQMVCSDIPEITVHPVRIGDVIWQSEVDIWNPRNKDSVFPYKQSLCRMFVEHQVKNSDLITYEGVICRLSTKKNSKWQVVDKF